jgi:hypothetical protein
MASKFETSFGARLRKFEDAIQFISNWPGYNPARPEIQLTVLQQMVQNIKQANEQQTQAELQYQTAVAARSQLFNKGPKSVEKLMAPIKANVNFLFGRDSGEAQNIGGIIRAFRSSALIKLPGDPASAEAQKTVSQSQRSYGSRTKFFADIVATLVAMGNYNSSNPDVDLPALQQKLTTLTTVNDAVATQIQRMATYRTSRQQVYDQMTLALQLIKDYAASKYGNRSAEYKSIMSLKVR